jgi:LSD1 subclass zinc finger protein
MPSAHTLHYAIPLCFARRMVRDGQHGLHFTCYRPLRYDAGANLWRCAACGGWTGPDVVIARMTNEAPTRFTRAPSDPDARPLPATSGPEEELEPST